MKKSLKLAYPLSVTSAIVLTTLVASAGDQSFAPVGICFAEGVAVTDLSINMSGAFRNYGTTGAAIVCGLGQDRAMDANDDVLVFFHDKANSLETVPEDGSVYCTATEIADDYSVVVAYADSGWGCSNVGGCSGAPDSRWTGTGYIQLTDISHGGNYFTVAYCNLPINGSQIRAFRLDQD